MTMNSARDNQTIAHVRISFDAINPEQLALLMTVRPSSGDKAHLPLDQR